MKFTKIIFLYCLMIFCVNANAQIEVELDHVAGLTRCSFKESKKGDYSYCSDKIKTIFIDVGFSKSVSISPHPQSISINYIYEYISNYYRVLDDEIDELKYDIKFMPAGKISREKIKNYLYVYAKFFPIEDNKIICVLLFNRNGISETDSFLIDVSKDDVDSSFKKELKKIDKKLVYELVLRNKDS